MDTHENGLTESDRRMFINPEEIREYQRLQRLFTAPTDNVELIKALFHTKDDPQPLYIGSKKTTVSL